MNIISIKEGIKDLILNQQYESAESKLIELEAIFPEDPDIYSMRAFIYFQQGETGAAKSILEKAILSNYINDDILFNRAQISELDHEYLRAIELYESLLFRSKDENERESLLNHLNKLEQQNYDQLIQEINNKLEESSRSNRHLLHPINVHLMYDSQYCDSFIQMVHNGMDTKSHVFLIITNKNQKISMITENTLNLPKVEIIDMDVHLDKLIHYLCAGNSIYIHYLFDYTCELICKLNLETDLNWIVWGGDIYNYVDYKLYDKQTSQYLSRNGFRSSNDINKKTMSYYYRKSAIRRISRVLTLYDGDFDIIKGNFLTKAKKHDFFYPNLVELDSLTTANQEIDMLDSGEGTAILLGNSANPSNQHIELIELISKYRNEDIKVIMPLSYGGNKPYIDYIVRLGKERLGDKFYPILDLLQPEEYANLLAKVDVALFNHLRQQAVGNIITLLYMGKKVFINPAATTFGYFRKLGLSIHDIHSIPRLSFSELKTNVIDLKQERYLVSENWSKRRSIKLFQEVLKFNKNDEKGI